MRIRTTTAISTIMLGAILLSACALQRARIAERAKTDMIGLSKPEILDCMGQPDSRSGGDGFEQWTYSRSDNPGIGDFGGASNSRAPNVGIGGETQTTARGRYCVATVTFRRDSVSSIRFSGTTGGIVTRDEQCAFLVSACTRQR